MFRIYSVIMFHGSITYSVCYIHTVCVWVWKANRLHTSNIMVGKFQLYSRFITYWLPFCWTKRSQLQRFPSIPHSCTLALSVHRVKGNHSVTIDSNCKHPRTVLGFCAAQHECYRQNIIFETISRGFVEDKKKWLLSFSIFIIILWATCFHTAPVFVQRLFFFVLFTICHLGNNWTDDEEDWSSSPPTAPFQLNCNK